MKTKIKFVCCCGITGLLICLFQRSMFTPDTLVETLLFICASLFLVAKYAASSLIAKKNTAPLQFASWQQIKDNAWLYLSFEVVQPLCLSFLYACAFLLLVKVGLLLGFDLFSQPIYDLNELNERYLAGFIWGLVSLVVFFTLLDIVSIGFSIRVKKLTSGFSYVFKVIAILVCFLHLDSRIVNKTIAFRMDNEPIKTEKKVSFRYAPEQEKMIKNIIENYVVVLLHRALINDRECHVPTSPEEKKHFHDQMTEMYENIKNVQTENGRVAITNFTHNRVNPFREEYDIELFQAFNNQEKPAENPGDEIPFYNSAHAATFENLANILKLLIDERKSFANEEESLSAELYRDEVESLVAKTFEVVGIKDKIPFAGFFGDIVNDHLHVLVTKGLYYLFKQAKVSGKQISEAINYGINEWEVPLTQPVHAIAKFIVSVNEYHNRLIDICRTYKIEHDAVINVGDESALAAYLEDFPNGGDQKVTEKFNAWIKMKNGKDISAELKELANQAKGIDKAQLTPLAADPERLNTLAKQFNLYRIAEKAFERHGPGKDFIIPDYATMEMEKRSQEWMKRSESHDPVKERETRVKYEPRAL
ncbi:hypothetical protein PQ469_02940 [Mucilaginibacter sp. KACC 22773]|uniref:hypothetical protein n=1 Tax=Mucilaginibacter sp. KACC 22773 TaxID=3025671 RepID=UPI00236677DF|nr:hypothetical protein [Mucilaginibacter sp. KACC 22773]WDF78960.1 hypothetical protein PQ469_02940 [Mucilaginibacter sp. KACC 22773]